MFFILFLPAAYGNLSVAHSTALRVELLRVLCTIVAWKNCEEVEMQYLGLVCIDDGIFWLKDT